LRQYDLRIDVKRLREISIQNIKRNRKCWRFPYTFLYTETFSVIVFTRPCLISIVKKPLMSICIFICSRWHLAPEVPDTDLEGQINSNQKRQWFSELYLVVLLACVVECCMQHNTLTYRHTSKHYQLKEYYKFSGWKKYKRKKYWNNGNVRKEWIAVI
jgi:hypothetical protein